MSTGADPDRARSVKRERAAVAYLVVAIAALVCLRASSTSLDFVGIGWIFTYAALPLLPWLLPRLGDFLKSVSPYVRKLSLGGLHLDLRTVQAAPLTIPNSRGILAMPNDVAALTTGTAISSMVQGLQDLRRQGGSSAAVIDLRDGRRWRLPNLYFLMCLLEMEATVHELVFTEVRGGTDGFLIGTACPRDVRQSVMQSEPVYAAASAALVLPAVRDLTDAAAAQPLGDAFASLLTALGSGSGRDDDPVHGYVSTVRLRSLVGSLSAAAVEGPGAVLDEDALRVTLGALHRFVPTTTSGRLQGLIDREAVALFVARLAVAHGERLTAVTPT